MSYNGQKDLDYWNVALWLSNDQQLYLTCKDHWESYSDRGECQAGLATLATIEALPNQTPDGVKYTVENVRAALVGMFGKED